MSTDKKRMEMLLAHLKMNANELAVSLGYKRSDRVYHVIRERNGISDSLARDINSIYPYISFQWLKTGVGDMLVSTTPTEKTEEVFNTDEYRLLQRKFNALLDDYKELKKEAVPLNPNVILYVPLVSQYAYAGYLNGYQNETYMENLPTIPYFPDADTTAENFVAFEVRGDSMDDNTKDALSEGDTIICRELPQILWKDSQLPISRWDFVIVHEEGIIAKRITNHDVPNHTITIHSLNNFYPDRTIDLAKVKQIFCIVETRKNRRRK